MPTPYLIPKIAGLLLAKGAVIAAALLAVAETSLWQATVVAVVSAIANGTILFLIARYGTRHVEAKVDEVKSHVDEKVQEVSSEQ